ncbi:MAG TPA: hypothetical protein VIY51_25365 [Xanthobacteraceae bacterium]
MAMLAPSGASAQAWNFWPVWHGNDTGGIIPWSCENESVAPQAAGAYCGRFGKYARITGVTRHYGDYISFNCLWAPNIARYDLPAVATRAYCPGDRRILAK